MGDMDDGFRAEDLFEIDYKCSHTSNDGGCKCFDDDEATAEVITEQAVIAAMTAYLGDAVFAQRFMDCMNIMRVKNVDYSQGEDKRDRIAAFRRIARDINVSMKQAWAVFAQKHWGAIMKFVKDGQVESEPISGRINDLINYCVLFGAIVDDEREREML